MNEPRHDLLGAHTTLLEAGPAAEAGASFIQHFEAAAALRQINSSRIGSPVGCAGIWGPSDAARGRCRNGKNRNMTSLPQPASLHTLTGQTEAERHLLSRDFVWGVSTSSYQIEGATDADGKGLSVWDTYCRVPGHIANGDTGDVACDHYHRYAEDIALMRELGVSAYRFSVAWPRVLPGGRGAANEAGLAFYVRLVDGLLAAGIDPWLCLYHWDLPQALQDEGGWLNRDIAGWFADYATLIARRLGDRVRHFATFNEPSVFTLFCYGFAWHPPGLTDPTALHQAIHHVNLAHGAGVDALRAN